MAATVSDHPFSPGVIVVEDVAVAGEVNDVTLRAESGVLIIADDAADLSTTAMDCTLTGSREVTCTTPVLVAVEVLAAGGGDRVRVDDSIDALLDIANVTVFGEGGNDTLTSGAASQRLNGGPGNDTLSGGAGSDSLTGSDGDDIASGGAGDDFVEGARARTTWRARTATTG